MTRIEKIWKSILTADIVPKTPAVKKQIDRLVRKQETETALRKYREYLES
jgi:hypothetical protein